MFIYENGVFKSTLLIEKNVPHGFSTRNGGISVLPHTKEMNVGFSRGDEDFVVEQNIKILEKLSGIENSETAYSPQIHSTIIRKIESDNFTSPLEACDGFITDKNGVSLLIRMADCTPILFYGSGVVCAVHAGWRGTVAGMCAEAVKKFGEYGVSPKDIVAAIGHCIHDCCFEVKEDFVEAVSRERGNHFVERHINKVHSKFFANLVSMNEEILKDAGVTQIDKSEHCTACNPKLFHSHRKTKGVRGTMGAVIAVPKM